MQSPVCDTIFIVGNSRSGTTMMSRILGLEPSVFAFNELHFFDELWSPKDRYNYLTVKKVEWLLAKLLCIQRDGYLHQNNPMRFFEEAKTIISSMQTYSLLPSKIFEVFLRYETIKNGKLIPCEQTGRNLFYISEILEYFPKARIINMIRDPRDVLLSQKYKWKRGSLGDDNPFYETIRSWFNYNPITISMLWKAALNTSNRFVNDPRVYSLRFEDLLTNPEERISDVCSFLGLTFRDNLLAIPQVGSSIVEDKKNHIGVDKGKTGSWKKGGLNSAEIYLCQKITKKLMLQYNYYPITVHPNLLKLFYNTISFPIKLLFAFLLNIKRMKNALNAIRRRLA